MDFCLLVSTTFHNNMYKRIKNELKFYLDLKRKKKKKKTH